jgi:hypothetical protein
MSAATKEFLEWSSSLKPWQQDALRRIVIKGSLSPQDEEEVIKILKSEHGIPCSDPLPRPAPLEQGHMPTSATQATLHLLGISNIQNANRIAPGSKLDFNCDGLTVVYGGNGSGKSGYTRILRNACRSRISSVSGKRNAILPNVYAPSSQARATANLHISINGTEKIVEWHDQSTSIDELAQIAVFDSEAATIDVDDSNHIAFLPFNIDLFYKLNVVCSSIRKRLEKEHEELKSTLSEIANEIEANTLSAQFLISLSAKTTKAEIDAALTWLDSDEARFQELEKLLQSSPQLSLRLRD